MSRKSEIPDNLSAFLWHFIKQDLIKFFILLISPLALIMESNVMPYAMKMLVDGISNYPAGKEREVYDFYPAVILFIGSWILMVVIFRAQEYICNSLHPKFQANIRMAVFDYVKQHSHNYFSNNFAGSISNKISDISRTSWDIFEFIRWRIIGPLTVVTAALIITAQTNLIFTIIIFLWVTIHIIICYFFSIRIDRLSSINAEDKSVLQGKIVDVLTNISNVRLFSRFGFEQKYVGDFQKTERKSNLKTNTEIWRVRLISEIPTILVYISLFYFSFAGWKNGTVTTGDLVFLIFASSNILWHIWFMSTDLPVFFNNLGISKQALTLIRANHEIIDSPDAIPLKVTKGEIVFDNVNFNYIKGKNIFKDKTVRIEAGTKVGLVGFSGSGKSTFVNLILRFFDVESGKILIDGQDISKVKQGSLRQNITMIPQDPSLFHRSLMENIRYGKLEATDDEVIDASRKAHCDEFISVLPEKYESLVGERGVKLSGGQRQRIAIARAILKNAPILILDEATSSLDSVTEKYIQESLELLMKGKTTIVIAHRLSTLANVDRIIVFDNGQVVEDGTHQELLKNNGHYAKLWNMQAGGFLPEL